MHKGVMAAAGLATLILAAAGCSAGSAATRAGPATQTDTSHSAAASPTAALASLTPSPTSSCPSGILDTVLIPSSDVTKLRVRVFSDPSRPNDAATIAAQFKLLNVQVAGTGTRVADPLDMKVTYLYGPLGVGNAWGLQAFFIGISGFEGKTRLIYDATVTDDVVDIVLGTGFTYGHLATPQAINATLHTLAPPVQPPCTKVKAA